MHPSRPADDHGPSARAEVEALDAALLRTWPLERSADSDKYAHGTVLVVGGTAETPGSVVLAAMAALRMGAGRVQIATVADVVANVAVAVPEALVCAMPTTLDSSAPEHRSFVDRVARAQCVLVGPGISENVCSDVVTTVLAHGSPEAVVVVDAAALDVIADQPTVLLEPWRGRLAATPNRGEALAMLQRMDGSDESHGDRAEESVLAALSRCSGAVVSSFGHVRAPDGRAWRAPAAHPGLGTSGSGDVLAGLVAGVAARCGDAAQAACWATYAHVRAGHHLGRRSGPVGFLARDLIAAVGDVLSADLGS